MNRKGVALPLPRLPLAPGRRPALRLLLPQRPPHRRRPQGQDRPRGPHRPPRPPAGRAALGHPQLRLDPRRRRQQERRHRSGGEGVLQAEAEQDQGGDAARQGRRRSRLRERGSCRGGQPRAAERPPGQRDQRGGQEAEEAVDGHRHVEQRHDRARRRKGQRQQQEPQRQQERRRRRGQ